MEKIIINFLGTGNAIPTEKRNHTGILVNFAGENILIDCGEGIQRQFKIAKISPAKINSILITHWHGDHVLGLPGLLQTLAMSGYQKTLHIYGPKGTERFIDLIKNLLMNIRIKLEVHELSSGIAVSNKDFLIEAKEMSHGIPTLAYSIIIKDRIHLNKAKLKKLKLPNSPLLAQIHAGKDILFNGKKITSKSLTYKEKGKKITIVLDTEMNQEAIQLAKNSDIVIAESTFSSEEKEKSREYKHLTATDAATIAKKSNSKLLILTHISQRYEHNLKIIEKEAKKTFKNTKIVHDFDSIKI